MPQNLRDLTYLLQGTETQQAAYRTLASLQIWVLLRHFDPILVGTIPLDIDIPGSDLDIVCHAININAFAQYLLHTFRPFAGFRLKQSVLQGQPTAIVQFKYHGFPIEIFAQPLPVMDQVAVKHMLVEARFLSHGGTKLRQQVRQLKAKGLKTEPAFATALSLTGDPYQTLLNLSEQSEDVLASIVSAT